MGFSQSSANVDLQTDEDNEQYREEYGDESDNEYVKPINDKLSKIGLGKLGKGRGFQQEAVLTDE